MGVLTRRIVPGDEGAWEVRLEDVLLGPEVHGRKQQKVMLSACGVERSIKEVPGNTFLCRL